MAGSENERNAKIKAFYEMHAKMSPQKKKEFASHIKKQRRKKAATFDRKAIERRMGYNPNYRSKRSDKSGSQLTKFARTIGDNLSSKNPQNKDDILQKLNRGQRIVGGKGGDSMRRGKMTTGQPIRRQTGAGISHPSKELVDRYLKRKKSNR